MQPYYTESPQSLTALGAFSVVSLPFGRSLVASWIVDLWRGIKGKKAIVKVDDLYTAGKSVGEL